MAKNTIMLRVGHVSVTKELKSQLGDIEQLCDEALSIGRTGLLTEMLAEIYSKFAMLKYQEETATTAGSLPLCDTCGMPFEGEGTLVMSENLAGVVMCDKCMH
jgi:hypothetical protein